MTGFIDYPQSFSPLRDCDAEAQAYQVSGEQSDGTQRLDVEYARSRVNAMLSTLKLLAEQADTLKADLGKLLDELDGTPSRDVTEPHIQVHHE